MRKQLNNPWIVAVLALVALACVARSLWPEKLQGIVAAVPAVVAAAGPRAPELAPVDPAAPPASEDLTALTGISARRDPFAPTSRSAGVVAAIEKPQPDFVDTVHLTALWAQDGATYAIINGNIVRPGDEIGRLKVESASADGVWLVHWQGRDHLALGEEFTLRTPAAGPTVVASSL